MLIVSCKNKLEAMLLLILDDCKGPRRLEGSEELRELALGEE